MLLLLLHCIRGTFTYVLPHVRSTPVLVGILAVSLPPWLSPCLLSLSACLPVYPALPPFQLLFLQPKQATVKVTF